MNFTHISSNGQDQSDCGDLIKKCKTVDYALNKTKSNNITLVFQTSATESLKYNWTKPLNGTNSIRFFKDNPEGRNPTIYGNNQPLIRRGEVDIIIDSINLHEVSLIDSVHSDSKISLTINRSSIYLTRSNFVSIKHAKKVQISFENSLLKSLFIIEGDKMFIDKYFWLDVERNDNTSHIVISKTKISGGRFQVKNVRLFHLTECLIKNNTPKTMLKVDTTEKTPFAWKQ